VSPSPPTTPSFSLPRHALQALLLLPPNRYLSERRLSVPILRFRQALPPTPPPRVVGTDRHHSGGQSRNTATSPWTHHHDALSPPSPCRVSSRIVTGARGKDHIAWEAPASHQQSRRYLGLGLGHHRVAMGPTKQAAAQPWAAKRAIGCWHGW
jgi:hypothetical protein